MIRRLITEGNIIEVMKEIHARDAQIKELRDTNTRLNRRCQEAESAARVRVEDCQRQGVSFGRALANWNAGDLRRKLESRDRKIAELKDLGRRLREGCESFKGSSSSSLWDLAWSIEHFPHEPEKANP